MAKLIAKHTGDRAQIIRVEGGNSVTLKPGEELPVVPSPALTEESIAHYKARGVTFTPEGDVEDSADVKSGRKAAAQRKAEAEKAAAEKAAAEKAATEKQAEIAEAEKNLAEAKALLDTAGDDLVAKGEAEAMVTAAEAALAALRG